MLFRDPPAVRVPTLEPSALSAGSTLLRSTVPDRPLSHVRLSDYYHPAPLSARDAASPPPRPPRSLRAAASASASASASPLPPRPSSAASPPRGSPQRSGSPDPAHAAESPPLRSFSSVSWSASPRQGSPRPAWNQNRPQPRPKPAVSAPRTEPRRLARETSADVRQRPWREGPRGAGTGTATALRKTVQGRARSIVPRMGSEARPSANDDDHRTVVKYSPGAAHEGETLVARVEFLELALQDAQKRAARAEASCDELSVSMQTMAMQHHEAMARLEQRTLQLAAQVHCLMQHEATPESLAPPVERCLSDEVNVEAEEKTKDEPEVIAEESEHHSVVGFDATPAPEASPRETVVRGTTVRVPPSPPMKLQWGQHAKRQ